MNELRTAADGVHARFDLFHRDPVAEPVARLHLPELVEKSWRRHEDHLAGVDRGEQRARAATRRQQRRHQHVGVGDDPHRAPERLLGARARSDKRRSARTASVSARASAIAS